MTNDELSEMIAQGESSVVEFKRDDVRPEQLAKEIVALANFQGGHVLLGVDDDGSVPGIQRPDLEHWVMDTVLGRYVHPQILPFYQEVRRPDGLRVAVIGLAQGSAKPYVVRHHGREEVYVRIGSTSRLATREQQARLFATGGLLHAELLPVSGTGLADLSAERIDDYMQNILGDVDSPTDARGKEQRLEQLGFLTTDTTRRSVCTVAGFVLFGRGVQRGLPQAGVRWMAFAGVDKEYAALDDARLQGPLVGVWRGGLGEGRKLLEPGLVERVIERMTPFISSEPDQVDASLRRQRRWDYPLAAVREALLNAMIHRDWTRSVEVEVVAYSDRLEITSPGALQNSMTVEKMLAGQRSPRNPLLVDIMRDYGYVDARGMGVRRKIVPLVRAESGEDARFEATDDYVRVILPKSTRAPGSR
ncbi:MAG: putative DNA binding domain-containing protein [Polyangiaceae bacterium]|nr:putative DNA binding domain-containing protein [Polyangiaceae bacterium]